MFNDVSPALIVATLLVGLAMLLAAGLVDKWIDRSVPRVVRVQVELVGKEAGK